VSSAARKPNWAMLAEGTISAALLLFALALFCRHVAALWGFTIDDSFDDSFITFRYSQNIASGIGPVFNAGAVPYLSGWKTIDTFGLNDRHIALHGHDPGYVLRQKPDVIVLISGSKTDFQPPLAHEKPLYESSVKAGFAKLETLEFSPAYFLWVMAKPHSKIARGLEQQLFFKHRAFGFVLFCLRFPRAGLRS
jgi:hypothetical protein